MFHRIAVFHFKSRFEGGTTNTSSLLSLFRSPDPIERYTFMTVGSDWPSILETSPTSQPSSARTQKRYANPIRRVWRRVLAAAAARRRE
jgi:hypothetical protein